MPNASLQDEPMSMDETILAWETQLDGWLCVEGDTVRDFMKVCNMKV